MATHIDNLVADNTFSANTLSANTIFVGGSQLSTSSSFFNSLSSTTISGGTLFSGSTNLYNIFSTIGGTGATITNASNVGSGIGVYKQTTGTILEFRSLSAGTNITFVTGDTVTINSTGGGSSRTTGSTTTTNATPTVLATVSLTDNSTTILEVYIKAYQTAAVEYGVWKRTLTVTKVSGTPVIQLVNSDVTKTSTRLKSNSVTFAISGGNITISVTGIAATTIGWQSAYEKIL